jgi:hypothetical protein
LANFVFNIILLHSYLSTALRSYRVIIPSGWTPACWLEQLPLKEPWVMWVRFHIACSTCHSTQLYCQLGISGSFRGNPVPSTTQRSPSHSRTGKDIWKVCSKYQ